MGSGLKGYYTGIVGAQRCVALDVGLHIPRRHQTNLVTKLREFTRPIMGAGARLHADKAWRQRLEELQHLAAPKLLWLAC